MDELDFTRYNFTMGFGRVSYIAQQPWAFGASIGLAQVDDEFWIVTIAYTNA